MFLKKSKSNLKYTLPVLAHKKIKVLSVFLRKMFSDSRDPIFSNSMDLTIIFYDYRDPIFNFRDPKRVPKTP